MSDIYETNTTSNTYSEEDAYAPVPEGAMPTETYMDENGVFLGKVYTDNLVVGNAKISTAMIETLIVGKNVQMGENAYISWNQITDQPSIPQTASDVGALPANSSKLTYIDAYGIYTGTIQASQIQADTLSAISANLGTITSGTLIAVDLVAATGTFSGSISTNVLHIDSKEKQPHYMKLRMDSPNAYPSYTVFKSYHDNLNGNVLYIYEEFNGKEGGIDAIKINAYNIDLDYANLTTTGSIGASTFFEGGTPLSSKYATQSWVLSQGFLSGNGAVDSGNSNGAWYRWAYNTSNYFKLGPAGASVYVNGSLKASWSSMPKVRLEPTGDGIMDGREFGANNPASMQPVLFDFFIGVPVDGERRIDLDTKFLEYVSSYDVFLSSGSGVVVKEKGDNYIILQGNGTVSFFVAGIQNGKEDVVGYNLVEVQDLGETVRDFAPRLIKRY